MASAATIVALAAFPAAASAAGAPPSFGLDSSTGLGHPPATAEFATMAGAGVNTVRVLFYWPDLQPTSLPVFDWHETDAVVQNAARQGIQILPFFLGSPKWLTGCATPTSDCQHQPPVANPTQESAWRSFLAAAVDRYKPGGQFWLLHPGLPQVPITAWQVWNEPDLAGFVGGQATVRRAAANFGPHDPRGRPQRDRRPRRLDAGSVRRARDRPEIPQPPLRSAWGE